MANLVSPFGITRQILLYVTTNTIMPPQPKCDGMQETLDNDEQRVGAEIVRRALPYSLKLIARNAGNNGSVTVQKVRGSALSINF